MANANFSEYGATPLTRLPALTDSLSITVGGGGLCDIQLIDVVSIIDSLPLVANTQTLHSVVVYRGRYGQTTGQIAVPLLSGFLPTIAEISQFGYKLLFAAQARLLGVNNRYEFAPGTISAGDNEFLLTVLYGAFDFVAAAGVQTDCTLTVLGQSYPSGQSGSYFGQGSQRSLPRYDLSR